MKKRVLIAIVIGIFLLVLPFVLRTPPKGDTIISYTILNYLLTFILIPILIYFTGNIIQKIKENYKIIHWSLLISFIGTGLFLLKEYLFYLFFGMAFKTGINLVYLILPNFLFPLRLNGTLLREYFIINNSFILIIGNLFLVFVTYFITGTIFGWIITKIKSRKNIQTPIPT